MGPFILKRENKQNANFWPKPWTNSLAKGKFLQCFYSTFLSSKKVYFLSRTSWKTFSGPIWSKKHRIKKMEICDQNHGLTPYQKCKFFHFLNSTFSSSKKATFLSRTPWKTFYGPISSKKQRIKKRQIFDQNHGLTPLENCKFCSILNSMKLKGQFSVWNIMRLLMGLFDLKNREGKNFKFWTKTMN